MVQILCRGLGSASSGVSRRLRRCGFTVADLISYTPNCVDELAVEPRVNFLSQIIDIDRYQVSRFLRFEFERMLGDPFARNWLERPLHQVFEQSEFFLGQFNAVTPALHRTRDSIKEQI